jgi:adenosylhomocysteine nucleosidase
VGASKRPPEPSACEADPEEAPGAGNRQNQAMGSAAPPRRVALLAPMRHEQRPLVRRLALRRAPGAEKRFVGVSPAGLEILATTTGIGPLLAARTAERVLESGPFDHVLVIGIAGGIGSSVALGDLIVPELVVDLASGSEHRPARLGDVPSRGTLATAAEVLEDPAAIRALEERGVVAIDMETAAIASVCEARGCPWSVFRAISDRAGDGSVDPAVLDLAGPDGGPDLPALARFLLLQPWRIPELVRLARGMRRAAEVAAAAAVGALQGLDRLRP